jgi:hypothetical protein
MGLSAFCTVFVLQTGTVKLFEFFKTKNEYNGKDGKA